MLELFLFLATLAVLVGSPLFSPLLARHVASKSVRRQRQLLGIAAALPAVFALGWWLDLRWLGMATNWLWMLGAYLAGGVLAMSCFRIRPKVLGGVLGVAAALPLLAGLLLGSVGFLGVLFIVGDEIPVRTERLADGRLCQVNSFGNATTSDGGYDVSVRRPLLLFPLVTHIERQRRWSDLGDVKVPALDSLCAATAGAP